MDHSFSLSLQDVDTINLSLSKAMAVAQMVGDCGGDQKPGEDEPTPATLFVVMQVIVDQLERIVEVMQGVGKRNKNLLFAQEIPAISTDIR